MAHESFEDEEVAAAMNELFVNIKVDREERPDIDQVYMSALQALGEPGGWPLTMFLTPDGEAFWGGTYFPKEARYGRPGFVSARFYDAGRAGNWVDEHYDEPVIILNRLKAGPATPEDEHCLPALRGKLLARRDVRPRPGLDDKILADWNGLMIAALVNAGTLLGEPGFVEMAREAFEVVMSRMAREADGEPRLGHAFRAGTLVFPGMATDYAAMMRAALALAEASSPPEALRLCEIAKGFAASLEAHHRDGATGYFCTAADDASDVVIRSQPTADEAVPNAHGLYAQALLKLASLTGDAAMRERADALIAALGPAILANPYGHASLLNACDQRQGEVEIVVVGDGSAGLRAAALATSFLNRTVRVAGSLGASAEYAEIVAYPEGKAAAFVCAQGRCSLPATRPDEVAERLAALRG
jgi:uncharacterized protein YyaL (SSP411 family)